MSLPGAPTFVQVTAVTYTATAAAGGGVTVVTCDAPVLLTVAP
jgi:hypothetical protein